MIDYDEDIFNDFGFVVYDECHHLGAETFSKALLNTNFKYTLGLSATPKRADGLTKVFQWQLGDICYLIKKRDDNDVDVRSDDGSGGTALYFKADGSTGKTILYNLSLIHI